MPARRLFTRLETDSMHFLLLARSAQRAISAWTCQTDCHRRSDMGFSRHVSNRRHIFLMVGLGLCEWLGWVWNFWWSNKCGMGEEFVDRFEIANLQKLHFDKFCNLVRFSWWLSNLAVWCFRCAYTKTKNFCFPIRVLTRIILSLDSFLTKTTFWFEYSLYLVLGSIWHGKNDFRKFGCKLMIKMYVLIFRPDVLKNKTEFGHRKTSPI